VAGGSNTGFGLACCIGSSSSGKNPDETPKWVQVRTFVSKLCFEPTRFRHSFWCSRGDGESTVSLFDANNAHVMGRCTKIPNATMEMMRRENLDRDLVIFVLTQKVRNEGSKGVPVP